MTGVVGFAEAYENHHDEISRLSKAPGQQVPGMDPADIASEMAIVLWKCTEKYDGGHVPFGAYWWQAWRNRRNDLLESYFATKRVHPIPVGDLPDVVALAPDPLDGILPNAPEGSVFPDTELWNAIARGSTPSEAVVDLGISRRTYYKHVSGWRNDDVRKKLSAT